MSTHRVKFQNTAMSGFKRRVTRRGWGHGLGVSFQSSGGGERMSRCSQGRWSSFGRRRGRVSLSSGRSRAGRIWAMSMPTTARGR